MKAIIRLEVPEYQIGEEVSCYFKDTMSVKGICEKAGPCEDAISRQAVIEVIRKCHCEEWIKADIGASIEALSSVTPAEKTLQFAEWVAEEIFSDNWEYNKDAFEELACRKLAELGIVRVKGNVYWELVEKREREVKE